MMKFEGPLRWAAVLGTAVAMAVPGLAQNHKDAKTEPEAKAGAKQPNEAEMMAMMMEMAKPGENHKRLQELAGTWDYKVKWWMNPEAPPSESSGTAVLRQIMGGRYLLGDHAGKMQLPGGDGKMMDAEFKGLSLEGYDNTKKKFVASWIDNMGTGIMNLEGTYDPATKTLTYFAEYEMAPGLKTKMREAITIIDRDHRTIEFYEDRGGKEVKTMEMTYARRG